MHSESAIELRGVAKKFRLFASQRDRLLEALFPKKRRHAEFWALQDIDLVIPRGQTLGILGRNGSGKSTLLQILAGIFPPSAGEVVVNGRVSALLELGAGFNPEFSGRENVIMNGLLRGLSPDEMRERMPEIEAFADVGEFFDRPVKTYSSGMFVRVAFAAAINVDPDILLVDEALAVGDLRFQHKCFKAIDRLKENGVTIVLVTHDISAVVQHCSTALVLESGRIRCIGESRNVSEQYYASMITSHEAPSKRSCQAGDDAIKPLNHVDEYSVFCKKSESGDLCGSHHSYNKNEVRFGTKQAEIVDYMYEVEGESFPSIVRSQDVLSVHVKVVSSIEIKVPVVGLIVKTTSGVVVYGTNTMFDHVRLDPMSAGDVVVFTVRLKASLNTGDYFIGIGIVEWCDEEPVFLDSRQSLFHVRVENNKSASGIALLDCSFGSLRL